MDPVRASRLAIALAMLLALAPGVRGEDFEASLEAAEQLRAKAAKAGAEWLQTGQLLDEARTAAADGDMQAAIALVEQARFQAEAAISQAEKEAEAWKSRVVR
jgi:hypothetical protein